MQSLVTMFKKGQKEGGNHIEDSVETIIGPSVKIEGEFASSGNVMIAGVISGKLSTTQSIRIESGAKISADVSAKEAIIAGEVKGNIVVEGHLEILASAKINGDIKTHSLSIEQGAVINGNCIMAQNSPVSAPQAVLAQTSHSEKKQEALSDRERAKQEWLESDTV